ncbi:hypothetical protein FM125_11185 [Micrococcus lylae]|uniref:Uncharacterized protein n=1 Tax=Micrococcus lylae TaxID=1273 RepID=A0A1R4JWN9_9MICC|nr:hypothetical protein FM125_11185 [Micrococcus lylae]
MHVPLESSRCPQACAQTVDNSGRCCGQTEVSGRRRAPVACGNCGPGVSAAARRAEPDGPQEGRCWAPTSA